MSMITPQQGRMVTNWASRFIGAGYAMGEGYGLGKKPKIETPGSYTNNKNNNGKFIGCIDCSGLIYQAVKILNVIMLVGTAKMQCDDNAGLQQQISITWDLKKMQPGDIIYFCGTYNAPKRGIYYERNFRQAIKKYGSAAKVPLGIKLNNVSHVALYWGNGLILHASGKSKGTLVEKIQPNLLEKFVVVKRLRSDNIVIGPPDPKFLDSEY
jgi:cell wall-associated NlpC family hydrolase